MMSNRAKAITNSTIGKFYHVRIKGKSGIGNLLKSSSRYPERLVTKK
jgi:hypothetical protein